MWINTDHLYALSQSKLLESVYPCQVTQSFFALVIIVIEDLAESGDHMPGHEGDLLNYLEKFANLAVSELRASDLASELFALRAHKSTFDLRPPFVFRLSHGEPLTVTAVLQTTLRTAYVDMLHKILFAQGIVKHSENSEG